MRYRRLAFLPPLLILLLAGPSHSGEPEKDLKDRAVEVRLAAVEAIRKAPPPKAEKLLLGVLRDRDWEVVEKAAGALREIGERPSLGPLLRLAITGPVRRVRLSAARSLLRIDAVAAARATLKRIGGKTAVNACEALAVLAPAVDGDLVLEGLKRGMSSKELPDRIAAARLLGLLTGQPRRQTLEQILKLPETSVRAAALDAIRSAPDEDDMALILGLLHHEDTNDVLARRVAAVLIAIVRTADGKLDRVGGRALFGSELAPGPKSAARLARLAGRLALAPPPAPEGQPRAERLVSPKVAEPTLRFALGHESEAVRAAGAHALGEIATEEMLDRLAGIAVRDASSRVRVIAVRALVRTRGPAHDGTFEILTGRLESDPEPGVREEAAVALGVADLDRAVRPLTAALEDKDWGVVVCSAVSLGKTRDVGAVSPLRALLTARDWKHRGAGVVGLSHVGTREIIPDLIKALGDPEVAVSRSAWESLVRLTAKTIAPSAKAWRKWWDENGAGFVVIDRKKAAQEAKKHGYAPTYIGVYEDLDVIVLQSRGDHIEQLLARLSIAHRLTRAGQVRKAALHPFAVFVSNCTGEIVPKDYDSLQWFVRVGGYLFSSCWGLHHTVEPVYPGLVRKLPTIGQVLENVVAEPCPTDSPYLEGVFEGMTRPIYVLYGAHLIEVLDPERVEVLIDSPTCADTWGGGDLACWFEAGHGIILDSANHFDLQGLERAEGLKSAEDRMAYAMDHMGLSYEDLRKLKARKIWSSRSKAAKEARDLSAFRFITNFVRHKRKQ